MMGVVLGLALTLALVAGLRWALGDPHAQLSDPANFRLDDNLTRHGHAAQLASQFSLNVGARSRRAAVTRVLDVQSKPWHAIHLLYQAPRTAYDNLDLMTPRAISRIAELEAEIRALPRFEHFCYRPYGPSSPCESPISISSVAHAPFAPAQAELAAFSVEGGVELVDAAYSCAVAFASCLRPHLLPHWCKVDACERSAARDIQTCLISNDETSIDDAAAEWIASDAGIACTAPGGDCAKQVA